MKLDTRSIIECSRLGRRDSESEKTHESENMCLRTWTGLVNKNPCLLEMRSQENPPGLLPPEERGLVVLEIFGTVFRVSC